MQETWKSGVVTRVETTDLDSRGLRICQGLHQTKTPQKTSGFPVVELVPWKNTLLVLTSTLHALGSRSLNHLGSLTHSISWWASDLQPPCSPNLTCELQQKGHLL